MEQSLTQAAIWDEVKDRLKKSALGFIRRSAAASLYCPGPGRGTGGAVDGRTHQRSGPISTTKIEDLAIELKKDYTIIMVTHNMQQAARVSDKTAFFPPGRSRGIQRNKTIILHAQRQTHRRLYHREVRLMRNRFDTELAKLNAELIEMGAYIENAIQSASEAC